MTAKCKFVDEKIVEGYQLWWGNSKDSVKLCDIWLEAWAGMKELMDEHGITCVSELDKVYEWSDFPSNCVQELEGELYNAGLDDPRYHDKRIEYCRELLQYVGADKLMEGNTRKAIAEAYFEDGDIEECDRLFSQWLEDDPKWGGGYAGWFQCYYFDGEYKNEVKAGEIIERAINVPEIRDRLDVVYNALMYYKETGSDEEKIAALQREFSILQSADSTYDTNRKQIPIESYKVGRNDPCPCGSGKKYKACHGKAGQI